MRLKDKLVSMAKLVSSGLLVLGLVTTAVHAGDATGNWSWVVKGRQGKPDKTVTAKLKAEGNKLTGSVSAPIAGEMTPVDIQEGTVSGNEISFKTARVVSGSENILRYKGTVSGDTITGVITFRRNGSDVHRDWLAKRK